MESSNNTFIRGVQFGPIVLFITLSSCRLQQGCSIQKLHQARGRQVVSQLIISCNFQSHGPMAPLFRRKNLVCFYCNKKSNIKYDGHITRWDCTVCESTNFLDEVSHAIFIIDWQLPIAESRMGTLQILPSQLKRLLPRS